MTRDEWTKAMRDIWGEDASPKRLEATWGLIEAEREACAVIAEDAGTDALEGELQDKEFLGKKYDQNSYGSGHNMGEFSASKRIADTIRARSD